MADPVPHDDLVDPEAPADGGWKVDTAAYIASKAAGPDPSTREDGIDVEVPPPVAPVVLARGGDPIDAATDALLRLAAARPWAEISLRDIAVEAGVPFAEVYARAPGKSALLLRLSRRLDRQALDRIARDDQPAVRDRLFEAMMSRLEVMEPHRAALIAIGRAEGLALAPALPRTVRALLEGSGVDTGGGRGALRLAAYTGVWARVLQVWRDDEGALNRTMAEIDRLLTRAEGRLKRVKAGF